MCLEGETILEAQEQTFFFNTLKEVRNKNTSRLLDTKNFIQHGKTSVYRHSVRVAFASYRLGLLLQKAGAKINIKELLYGALLHDYFLYDWHVKSSHRPLHGFFHPKRALVNADRDFQLTNKEKDIIQKHMFPLTLSVPKYLESVVVCLADKWVSLVETVLR